MTCEREDEGWVEGPSSEDVAGARAALEIAAKLLVISRNANGELTADAATLAALRDDEKIEESFDNLFGALCPEGVSLEVWMRWLAGGAGPYEPVKLQRKRKTSVRPYKTKELATKRVLEVEQKLTNAKAAAAAAEREVAKVERELLDVRNVERAELHWHVSRYFADHLSAAFAMGPAWTIMRAISERLPKEVIEARSQNLTAKERPGALEKMKTRRSEETKLIAETLDHLSGDVMFEEQVRKALLEVCGNNQERRLEAIKEGRRPRSKEARATRVNQAATDDAEAVLAGLPKTT